MAWDTVEVTNVIILGENRKTWVDRYTKVGVVCERICNSEGLDAEGLEVDPATGLAARAAQAEVDLAEAEVEQVLGE